MKPVSVRGSGRPALVDDADYERVSKITWRLSIRKRNPRYVVSDVRTGGRMVKLLLHRVVLGAPPGIKVDHRDRDTLNNVRSNLRLATSCQSAHNVGKIAGCSSRYKGVSWDASRHSWRVKIISEGRTHRIGRFSEEVEAARAYDVMALLLHGEFAVLNFPDVR